MANYSKYRNRKVVNRFGEFDSKHEYERFLILRELEATGYISGLKRQVEYILIPDQYAESTETFKKGPNKGLKKPGRLLERKCSYIADFVYSEAGETVVEDAKGFRTPDYIIKRKLLLFVYGIQIKEV